MSLISCGFEEVSALGWVEEAADFAPQLIQPGCLVGQQVAPGLQTGGLGFEARDLVQEGLCSGVAPGAPIVLPELLEERDAGSGQLDEHDVGRPAIGLGKDLPLQVGKVQPGASAVEKIPMVRLEAPGHADGEVGGGLGGEGPGMEEDPGRTPFVKGADPTTLPAAS
jgi:hypothetical protein